MVDTYAYTCIYMRARMCVTMSTRVHTYTYTYIDVCRFVRIYTRAAEWNTHSFFTWARRAHVDSPRLSSFRSTRPADYQFWSWLHWRVYFCACVSCARANLERKSGASGQGVSGSTHSALRGDRTVRVWKRRRKESFFESFRTRSITFHGISPISCPESSILF